MHCLCIYTLHSEYWFKGFLQALYTHCSHTHTIFRLYQRTSHQASILCNRHWSASRQYVLSLLPPLLQYAMLHWTLPNLYPLLTEFHFVFPLPHQKGKKSILNVLLFCFFPFLELHCSILESAMSKFSLRPIPCNNNNSNNVSQSSLASIKERGQNGRLCSLSHLFFSLIEAIKEWSLKALFLKLIKQLRGQRKGSYWVWPPPFFYRLIKTVKERGQTKRSIVEFKPPPPGLQTDKHKLLLADFLWVCVCLPGLNLDQDWRDFPCFGPKISPEFILHLSLPGEIL